MRRASASSTNHFRVTCGFSANLKFGAALFIGCCARARRARARYSRRSRLMAAIDQKIIADDRAMFASERMPFATRRATAATAATRVYSCNSRIYFRARVFCQQSSSFSSRRVARYEAAFSSASAALSRSARLVRHAFTSAWIASIGCVPAIARAACSPARLAVGCRSGSILAS